MGKSTLALKFGAGKAERCGGWRRLVFRLSACSMALSRTRGFSTQCWARAPGGRRRTPLRRCVGGFTSCCSLLRGAGRGWQSFKRTQWVYSGGMVVVSARTNKSHHHPRPARAGRRVADRRVSVGGQSSRRGRPNGCSRGRTRKFYSAIDLQHCDWCDACSLTMLKCGKCRLV